MPSYAEPHLTDDGNSEVAKFCAQRWGMTYQEHIGSDGLIRRLPEAPQRPGELEDDLVVIPPGGTVEQKMFIRMQDS